ncbi:MAG TPA: hypothetical protein VI776_00875 [Anaerolineales bacterium]|nr:hypothetical protein [Anaerolineales bacterium]
MIESPTVQNKTWYTRQGLWSLFLICALPIHLWTLILAVKDFSWVSERTNAWDAIGLLSYGMVFAFVESLAVTLAAVLLGFLISRQWEQGRRIALLSTLVLIAALWAMAGQLYFLWGISIPGTILGFLAGTGHPVRILYAVGLALVTPTVLIPAYLVLESDRVFQAVQEFSGRLALLAGLYLLIDAVCLVILVARNL